MTTAVSFSAFQVVSFAFAAALFLLFFRIMLRALWNTLRGRPPRR